jgi:hypothetical protein
MKGRLLRVVWLAAVVWLGPGCIESRCYGDGDCPTGKVCLEETGKCVEAQCSAAEPCPPGYLCKNSFCQQGCLTDGECGDGYKCDNAQCTPYQEGCDCTAAVPFCGTDLNPNSASGGQQVCLEAQGEGGIALFFGSVKCSHCWANFERVEAMRDELRLAGHNVSAQFIHLKTVDADAQVVAEKMGWATSPVIADSDTLNIWETYLADWYHLVIVDRHGCVANHFGPVVPSHFDGDDNPIRQAWIDSLSSECPGPRGEDIGPDLKDVVTQEVTTDVVATPETVELPDVQPADVPMDLPGDLPDYVDDVPPDQSVVEDTVGEEVVPEVVAADILPFEPAEFCQILPGDPIELSSFVPYFLCQDANQASVTFGQPFSPWSMKGKVWLAYFGSCT